MPRMRTSDEPVLPRKLTIRADHRKLVLVKRPWESERHVLLKALVFALYVPAYPDLAVERAIGHRYKPDLVHLDAEDRPEFWAECGETARDKLATLTRTLPRTHLVIAKQATNLAPFVDIVRDALPASGRAAIVELLNFPADAARHLGDGGRVTVTFDDCEVVRIEAKTRRPGPWTGSSARR